MRNSDDAIAVVIAVAGLKIEAGLPLSENETEVGTKFLHDVWLWTAAPQLSARAEQPRQLSPRRHHDAHIDHAAALSVVVKVIAGEGQVDWMAAMKPYPARKVSLDSRAVAVADVPAAQNSQRRSLERQQLDPAHEDSEVARSSPRMVGQRIVPSGALIDLISRNAPDHADIRIQRLLELEALVG